MYSMYVVLINNKREYLKQTSFNTSLIFLNLLQKKKKYFENIDYNIVQ